MRARHVHLAFAPRRLPSLDPHRRPAARARRDDILGLRLEPGAARRPSGFARSSARPISSSSTRPKRRCTRARARTAAASRFWRSERATPSSSWGRGAAAGLRASARPSTCAVAAPRGRRRGHDRRRGRVQRRVPDRLARRTLAARVPPPGQLRRRAIDARRGRRRRAADSSGSSDETPTCPTHRTYPTCPTQPTPMKIAVIGGAGVRTPLLVGGLDASDLPIDSSRCTTWTRIGSATIGRLARA